MAKSKNRQRHQSGNPIKRQSELNSKNALKEKKPIPAVPIVIGIVALIVVIAVSVRVFDYFHNEDLMNKRNFIDEKNDVVILTYPASIFNNNVQEMADSMKDSEGVYDLRINKDNSLTVKLTVERYNNIKSAAENAVNSMVLVSIDETTAIREYVPSDNYTVLDITVNPETETLTKEINDAVYYARLYQVSAMNSDAKISVNYILEETGEVYMTEIYDINGKKLETKLVEEVA